jgi:ABC-type tungstate transport system permease subunit
LLISVLQLDSSLINPYSIPTWYPARKKLTADVKVIKIINWFFQLFFKKNIADSNKIK